MEGRLRTMKIKSNIFLPFFGLFLLFLSPVLEAEGRIGKAIRKSARFNLQAGGGTANLVWESSMIQDPNATDPSIWIFESGFMATAWTITLTNAGTATSGAITIQILANTIHFGLLDACTGGTLSVGQSCQVTVSLLTQGMAYGTISRTLRATQNGLNKDITLYACDNFTC